MRKEMIYKQIENAIRQRIREGVYPERSQIPTDMELAEEFHVTRLTVAKGLAPLCKAGLLERTRGRGSFVCASPETAAPEYSGAIKYVTPGSVLDSSPVSHGILLGIHETVRGDSQCAVGVEFYSTTEEELTILGNFRQRGNAGYIVWPAYDARITEVLKELEANRFPFVQIDSLAPGSISDYVGGDNLAGGAMMIDHLVALGHRRILYLTVATDRNTLAERLAGVISALTYHGIGFGPENLLCIPANKPVSANVMEPDSIQYMQTQLRQVFRQAPSEWPTVIFACNDSIALSLLPLLRELHLRVPEDISLAGYDDIDQAAWAPVPLTTVAQNFFAMGKEAGRLLLERRQGLAKGQLARQYRVPPRLVARQSVRNLLT